ncbi:MAG TPA: type II toxin-antitoxin system YoeB family toxin [Candidatus Limicola stercorigallinarum]|nr:type II toxin-antitoxin system YoeB family toxin [Candidatus Limicola stercorigallinarum]
MRGNKNGLRSAHIDAKNRLVFAVDGDVVRVVSCRGHYED